jgi:hypothetical protein
MIADAADRGARWIEGYPYNDPERLFRGADMAGQ